MDIHGIHRYPWISMESIDIHEIHGYPWNPWISMKSMDIINWYPWGMFWVWFICRPLQSVEHMILPLQSCNPFMQCTQTAGNQPKESLTEIMDFHVWGSYNLLNPQNEMIENDVLVNVYLGDAQKRCVYETQLENNGEGSQSERNLCNFFSSCPILQTQE